MDRTDEELVLRSQDGDTEAFAELVRRYQDAVYAIGLHVLDGPHEAAGVAQDALVRAYQCLDQLREPSRFSSWLCRIATNLARRRLSSKRKATGVVSLDAVDEMPDSQPSSSKVAEKSELVTLVRQLLEKLADEQRLTFTLFYVNGYSERDLSQMLEVPVGTVKSRLRSARSKLKKEILHVAREVMKENKKSIVWSE